MNSEIKQARHTSSDSLRQDGQSFFPRPAAWAVLALALAATFGGWLIARQRAELEVRKRFEDEAGRITAALTERMQIYQDVLHGAAGLFAASASVERSEWRAYVNSVSIDRRYPGIDAVGFAARVSPAGLEAFVRSTRADQTPEFEVTDSQGTNDLIVIKYLEPEASHRAMLGWNMGADPVRRDTAERACDFDEAALSGPVIVRDTLRGQQPGFLMMLPVYRRGLATNTLAERRTACEGWVFGRFVTEQLMRGVLGNRETDVHFRVLDGATADTGRLVFDDNPDLTKRRRPGQAWFSMQDPLQCAGRVWWLCYETKPSFEAVNRRTAGLLVLAGGGIISLLLFCIAWSLGFTRERALAMASSMTRTLRETNDQLATEIRAREHSQRRMATQFAVTRLLAESVTLPEATPQIIRAVCENLGWQVGALWEISNTTGKLHCVEFWCRPNLDVSEFESATRRTTFARGEGLPGRVWAASKPAWIKDVAKDPNFPRAPFAVKVGLHAAFGFPITMGNELLGVIEFFSREISEPDPGLLSMMTAAGSQIGQFIERKHSEAALRHSEATYHSLVESLPLSIIRKDLQGRFIFANQRFCTRMGIALPDLVGKTEAELFPVELAAKRERWDRQAIESSTMVEAVEERTTPDGETQYVQAIRTPLYDENQALVGLLGIFWDVTDRRRAEAQLEHEQFLLRTLMDNLPDRIYFKDAQGRFLRNSRAHLQRLGIENPTAALGRTDFDFLARETALRTSRDEEEVIRSGRPINKEEKTTSIDGRTTWAMITKMPLRNEKGETVGTFGISRDITDRKRAEEAMRSAKEAAEEANRAKSQFLASMSHELRTPLNSVIGFANILLKNKSGTLEATELNFLNRILANGKHLLSLINQILDLSKIEARKLEVQESVVALDALLRETLAQQEGLVRDKPVKLLAEVPEGTPPIRTDPDKLRQIIINLVGNALKFTERGSITVRVVTDPVNRHAVRIDVIDTGIGIPKDKLGLIFEAFQQAEEGTARKYGGTGLGLTISKALCQLMGYRIEVASEIGRGSTFSVCLTSPRTDDAMPAAAQTEVTVGNMSDSAPDTKGKLVLVIDDELDSRTLLTHMIEEFGCQVITASSGEQGLHMAREFHPHVITVDLMMPQMDGWQLVRAIKADSELRDIPVVVVSIVARENRGRILGAVDVLQKPVSRDELLACLRRCLSFDNPRLLIVDDEEDSRRLLTDHLSEDGYTFRTAVNGREALAVMEEFPPDLVLLDLIMPVMDGMAFLSRIRSMPRFQFLPVVVVTSKDLTPEESLHLRQFAQDVVSKGDVFEADLKSILRRLLQARPRPGPGEPE